MAIEPWNAVFLAGFAVYVAIRHVYEKRARGAEKVVNRFDRLEAGLLAVVAAGTLILPLIYLCTPWLAFADYRLPAAVPRCGAAVMIAALWLFHRSHADLGRNWAVTLQLRRDHELVRSGVYRRVRHPMYAAILLFGVAQGMLLANWLAGWSALATFALLYILRTPREERMLLDHFGEPYRDYMRASGRLLPRWRRGK
ncbi:MAG: isoprenylcysteine carboxylmethyltransferase family protein [Planctomycetes bacterium]|nr:isoprenylcysteine carboxylmethyltransferase family protein [Planctomycetota bacterium]